MKKILPSVGSFNLGGAVDDNKKVAGWSVSTTFYQPIAS